MSTHDHGMERDHLTLCSEMIVELGTRTGAMGDEDQNEVEDKHGYVK